MVFRGLTELADLGLPRGEGGEGEAENLAETFDKCQVRPADCADIDNVNHT